MEGHSPRCICLLCVLRKTSKRHKLVVPCRFNLLNSCKFSCDECRFTHYEYDEIPPCRNGVNCRFGPTKCLFLHDSFEGDGNAVENLPQSNTEHAAEELPAGTVKKTKRKNRKKKNKNKSRLVESKQDSLSTQNPYQSLVVEEMEESDSESEGESESDSLSEAIPESCPLSHADEDPSPEEENTPTVNEVSKEVIEDVIPAPVSNSSQDSPKADPILREEEKEVIVTEIPASTTNAQLEYSVDTPDSKSSEIVEPIVPPSTVPHVEIAYLNNRPTCYRCTNCEFTIVRGRPPRNKNRYARLYSADNFCTTCGKAVLPGTFFSHPHAQMKNFTPVCPYKYEKHCDTCLNLFSK